MENLCHSSSLGEFHEIRDKETMNSGLLQVQKTLQKWKEAELQEITVSEYIAFLQWPGTNFPQKYLKGEIISSYMSVATIASGETFYTLTHWKEAALAS